MVLTDVKIQVPESIVKYTLVNDSQAQLRRNAMMIFPFIQDETISYGKAAELLGISKLDLISIYSKMGISYLDESEDDLSNDIYTIQKIRGLA